MSTTTSTPATDLPTLVAISSLAYLLDTALHEHLGHGLACAALGGSIKEAGAFYVDCHYAGMGSLNIRLVALAGPLVSLLVGLSGFAVLRRLNTASAHLKFFVWLLASLGLMTATGYLLFSGVSGLGDFGFGPDGALLGWSPEWLWRILLSLLGALTYGLTIRQMLRTLSDMLGGSGSERPQQAQRLALTAYLTGGLVSVLIGLLNPQGIFILLASAAAASLGGSSALAWAMRFVSPNAPTPKPLMTLPRQWVWIGVGLLFTLIYGLLLGPSIKP